mgnify:CR=1 FL=1
MYTVKFNTSCLLPLLIAVYAVLYLTGWGM